jgi:hypothetical protein
MILSESQIKSIILDNPNREIIRMGTDYNKKMRLHLYGEGLEDHHKASRIDGYEGESLHVNRVKYGRSNKDVFGRLGRPIDKVFSARGGSMYLNLPDTQDKRARMLSMNVRDGLSIKKWLETFWKPHALDDPAGLLFMEILPQQEAKLAQQQGRSFVYPTYKAISSIHDYQTKGNALEYVVFKVSKSDKSAWGIDDKWEVYRVVDDAMDYLVRREGENVTILKDFSIQNYFGEVPGRVNSDLVNPCKDGCFISLYDEIIELADHFLLKGSIKLTHEFLHGFPKYWEYADDCPDCGGTKFVGGEKCSSCRGTGKKIMLKVSDAKLLAYPENGTPIVTPEVAGYVSPDKTYWEIATADIAVLEELMNVTLWGASSKVKTKGLSTDGAGEKDTTATEEMLDIKPEADRLSIISEMAEKRHKFILDAVIRLQVSPTYSGSSVSYGRRYMIEGPDALKEKYARGKAGKLAPEVLDQIYLQYLEAEFHTDEFQLAIEKKKLHIKPFFHEDVELSTVISELDKTANKYFLEWLKSIGGEAALLAGEESALREQLYEYARTKMQEKGSEKEEDLQRQAKYQQKPNIAA